MLEQYLCPFSLHGLVVHMTAEGYATSLECFGARTFSSKAATEAARCRTPSLAGIQHLSRLRLAFFTTRSASSCGNTSSKALLERYPFSRCGSFTPRVELPRSDVFQGQGRENLRLRCSRECLLPLLKDPRLLVHLSVLARLDSRRGPVPDALFPTLAARD